MAMDNAAIAETLARVADLLEAQEASPFRVAAYRKAADAILDHGEPLADVLRREGLDGLEAIPTIGPTIAAQIAELVRRGGLTLLDRLEGELSPERLLATLPGIGPVLAHRLHEQLHVNTLEDLEVAACDGRLETLPGFGRRRARAIRQQLATILSRSRRGGARRAARRRPDLTTLLATDAEYRERAERDELRRIAPRRFNPEGKAWLPVLHADRDGWHATALFSNTARAHELGRTHDWVVIFYERDGDAGQCTVVTETRGPLTGRRVVRGREAECLRHYEVAEGSAPGTSAVVAPRPSAGRSRKRARTAEPDRR
jgi:predicted flap endonuclease-1-like 5' DNA nuclease